MTLTAQAILGATLPLAVPLLLAAAELMSLRRGQRRDGDDDRPPPPPVAPRPSGGQRPLPDCLVPKVGRVRERV